MTPSKWAQDLAAEIAASVSAPQHGDHATEALLENDEYDRRRVARDEVEDNDWVARYGFGVEDQFYGKGM